MDRRLVDMQDTGLIAIGFLQSGGRTELFCDGAANRRVGKLFNP
jgi:hypothetical protein